MNILSCTKEIKTFSCLWTYSAVRSQSRLAAVYEHIQLYKSTQDIQLLMNIFSYTKTVKTSSCLWTYSAVYEYIQLYEGDQDFQLFVNISSCTKTVKTFSFYEHIQTFMNILSCAKEIRTFNCLWTYSVVRKQPRLSAVYEHIELYKNSQDVQLFMKYIQLYENSQDFQLLMKIFICLLTYWAVRRRSRLSVFMNILSCTKPVTTFSCLWTYSAVYEHIQLFMNIFSCTKIKTFSCL